MVRSPVSTPSAKIMSGATVAHDGKRNDAMRVFQAPSSAKAAVAQKVQSSPGSTDSALEAPHSSGE